MRRFIRDFTAIASASALTLMSCPIFLCAGTYDADTAPSPYILCDTEDSDDDHLIMVSIGDSYSAGEGVEPYYGQDADDDVKLADPDFIAHRSTLAWPGQLVIDSDGVPNSELRDTYWYFAASSGADIRDVAGYYDGDDEFGGQYRKYLYNGSWGTVRLDPQLDIFEQLPEDHPADYVTVTIGGNDLGFRKMLTTLALTSSRFNFGIPEDMYEDAQDDFYHVDDNGVEDGMRAELRRVYYDIAEAAGPQAVIIVVGYPKLIDPDGSLAFDDDECELINEACVWFNNEISLLVDECREDGLNICFVSVEEAFEGHGAYSDDPYLNPIEMASDEDLKPIISSGSMHPNEDGVEAYRRCVQAKIDELEEERALGQIADGLRLFRESITGAMDVIRLFF